MGHTIFGYANENRATKQNLSTPHHDDPILTWSLCTIRTGVEYSVPARNFIYRNNLLYPKLHWDADGHWPDNDFAGLSIYILFGCAISLYKIEAETRITRPFRFVSQSGFSPFSLPSFPSFLLPDKGCNTDTPAPLCQFFVLRPFPRRSLYAYCQYGISSLPLQIMRHGAVSRQKLFFLCQPRVETNSCPLTAPSVFIIPLTSCQLFSSSFFVTAFYWSRHIVFRCKVSMQPGATHGLDQWRNSTNLPLSSLRFGRTPK